MVLEPPKNGHFRSLTKTQVVAHQQKRPYAAVKFFEIFRIFGPTSHPRTPPNGPGTPPKRSIPESNQKQGCVASTEES